MTIIIYIAGIRVINHYVSYDTVSGNISETHLSSTTLPLSTTWTQQQEGNLPHGEVSECGLCPTWLAKPRKTCNIHPPLSQASWLSWSHFKQSVVQRALACSQISHIKEQSSRNQTTEVYAHTSKNHQTFQKGNTKKDALNTMHRRTDNGGNKVNKTISAGF